MLLDQLTLSYVPRWPIVSMNRTQSVAEHCHRVASILLEFGRRIGLQIPGPALTWAILHDGSEAWTGDIPSPYKTPGADAKVSRWYHEYKDIMPGPWLQVVKLCDLIETATWIAMWGAGPYARVVADQIRGEVLEKAGEVAPLLSGATAEQVVAVVSEILSDITSERARIEFYRASSRRIEPAPDPDVEVIVTESQ